MPPIVNPLLPTKIILPAEGPNWQRRLEHLYGLDAIKVDDSPLCRLTRDWLEVELFMKLIGQHEKVAKCRFATREQQEAFRAYDGLNQSPFTQVTLPIRGADGRTINKTFSVADMAIVDPSERSIAASADRLIDDAIAAGIVSYVKPSESDFNGLPAQSLFVTEPSRLLSFPDQLQGIHPMPADYSGGGCNNTAGSVPRYWPIPMGFRQLYLTPKALRGGPDGVSDETLSDFMERAVSLTWQYLVARNVNPAYHPTCIAAQVPQLPSWPVTGANAHEIEKLRRYAEGKVCKSWGGETDSLVTCLSRMQTNPDTWRRDAIPGWNMPAPNATPGQARPIFRGPSDALWRQSLLVRHPRMGLGSYLLDGQYIRDEKFTTVHADALKDVLSALAMLRAVTDCGSYAQHSQGIMADIHAASTVFNIVQREAYRQLDLEYGTGFAEFSTAVDAERNARENAWRSDVVRTFGNSGYRSNGDAKADILASTIGSVGLALTVGMAAGPGAAILCVVVAGVGALLKYFARPTPPPDKRRWGVRAQSNGACVWGGSAEFNRMALGDILSPGSSPIVRVS